MDTIPQLIICGSIALDRIMNFSGRYRDLIKPEKVHVLSLSLLLKNLQDTPGGTGANIAYSLALLGEKPILLGVAGRDADDYLESLKKVGVDTSNVHRSHLKTASFNVITDQDDNQVGGFYPGAMDDSESVGLSKWEKSQVLVTVSAHDPVAMRRQVAECKQMGHRLFYDVGQQVSNISPEEIREGLAAAELLIVNDYELATLCDKIQETPQNVIAQIPVVVTTKGREGSVIGGTRTPQKISVGIAKPAVIIDPTGAGDSYRAGFLYGYVRGWSLEQCAKLGAVTSSFAIEHHGTQAHQFTKEDLIKRYKSNFGKPITL